MPRRSRRLNPPCLLDGLSDDVVMRMFSRAPFTTHGSLHAVCEEAQCSTPLSFIESPFRTNHKAIIRRSPAAADIGTRSAGRLPARGG